jgi:type VI secretion system protein ImpK
MRGINPMDLQRDTVSEQQLPQLCAESFLLIMQLYLAKSIDNAEVLRRKIMDLFDDLERKAKRAHIETERVHDAKFALVAFIDEVIAASEWEQKDLWLANPLQLELFNRNDAGEEFFARLDQLRKRPQANADILEVYYLCMALGFKGKYAFQETDRLRLLIEDTENDLQRVGEGQGPGPLAPNGKQRDKIADVVKEEVPLWVMGVAAAAIGFVYFLVMTFMINGLESDIARTLQGVL